MAKKSKSNTKVLRHNQLRSFTNQYRHFFIDEYLYIECPTICSSFIKAANWSPKIDIFPEVDKYLSSIGKTITLACVYHKLHRCYYLISHLWIPHLYVWAPEDMKIYMEKVNGTMLKYAFRKDIEQLPPEPVKKEVYAEVQKDVKESVEVTEKRSKFLDKIITEIEEKDFFKKYGLSIKTYKAMCEDPNIIVENFEEETHILDFHKFLFNKYRVLIKDTMQVLDEHNIIFQDKSNPNYKNNYILTKEFVAYDFGYNVHNSDKNTTFPVLYKRGIFTILLVLYDGGVLNKQIIPNLF